MTTKMRFLLTVLATFFLVEMSFAEDQTVSTTIPLKTPRKKAPRQGGPLDKVQLAIWIPGDVKVVRGAVVNPFYLKAVDQKHWQAAARHWGFAIVGANYFGVKPADFSTLLDAMKDFAKKTGRKELEHLPFCFVGMSAGGGMSMRLTELMPDRTIAAAPVCLEVGPRSVESRSVPIVTIFGERDGKQMEKLLAKLPVERKEDAQWAIAVQWRKKHEFARANNLAMPFFDHVIALRYPKDATPVNGPVKLQKIDPASGWYGDVNSWKSQNATIASAKKSDSKKEQTCWFPDEYTAQVWRAFVSQNPTVKIADPKGLGDGATFAIHPADKPLVVKVALKGKFAVSKVALFDGNVKLKEATTVKEPLMIPQLKPGIHALFVVAELPDGELRVSAPNTLIVK